MDDKLLTIRASENVIRILPPLNVKKQEIDLAIKILKKRRGDMAKITANTSKLKKYIK